MTTQRRSAEDEEGWAEKFIFGNTLDEIWLEGLGETEGGFFEEAVEEFGNSEGDGETGEGAEPSAPEGFRGEAVDHVDETEANAPVDEVDGIGAGAEVLDDRVRKPRAHASEGGGEEDGGEGQPSAT